MQGNVMKYLEGIDSILPEEIISLAAKEKLSAMAAGFADFAASEYILETRLAEAAARIDFSFRVLAAEEREVMRSALRQEAFVPWQAEPVWQKIMRFTDSWPEEIPDIWLEMDHAEIEKKIPQPCFFFNAAQIKTGTVINEALLQNALTLIWEAENLAAVNDRLKQVITCLPPAGRLFQVGLMLARNTDRVRIFTDALSGNEALSYMAAIGWPGSIDRLNEIIQMVDPYSDGEYIVDFDISPHGISEQAGINFGLQSSDLLPDFIDMLVEQGLCHELKRQGMLTWGKSTGCFLGKDYGFSALMQNISHFKFSCLPAGGIQAKAYLRIYGIYLLKLLKGSRCH